MSAVPQQVNLTQLQFLGNDDTAQKLRRLVTELVASEKAINALINVLNNTAGPDDTVPKHVLADTKGLGPDHTTSGLTAGMVLRALGAAQAAFAKLSFADLLQSNINNPENGDVIQFVDGYWQAADISEISGSIGENLGTGAFIYSGNAGTTLEFRSLVEGTAITLTTSTDGITIACNLYTVSDPGIVPFPGTADRSQVLYDAGWGQRPLVATFGTGAPVTIGNDGDLYFDTTGTPYLLYVQLAGAWQLASGAMVSDGTTTLPGTKLTFRESLVTAGATDEAIVSRVTFVFAQASAVTNWVIPHNLNRFPSVTVVETSGHVMDCEVIYVDANNIDLNFSAPITGTAYLN